MSKQLRHRLETLRSERSKALNVKASLLLADKQDTQEARDLESNLNEITADIETIESMMALPSWQALNTKQEAEERQKEANGIATAVTENVTAAIATSDKSGERRQRQETQLRSYLKHGNVHELRDVAVSVDNGALVPQEFGLVTEATKFTGQIVGEIYKYDAQNGAAVKLPVSDDTASGLIVVAETGSSAPAKATPTVFSTTNPGAATLLGRVDYSKQWSDDSVAGYLQRLIGPRVARALATAVMVGTDSAGTALTGFAPTGGYLAGIPVGTTTATVAGGIGIDDIVNLYESVDASYQEVGSFFLHQKTRAYLLGLKSSTGASLFATSPQDGLKTLMGRPVYIDNNMPAPTAGVFGAGSTPVIFGDHSRAFGAAISDVNVRVLTERYADVMLNSMLHYVHFQSAKLVQAASAKLAIAAS